MKAYGSTRTHANDKASYMVRIRNSNFKKGACRDARKAVEEGGNMNHEKLLKPVYAMANISRQQTGQPFSLWIDSIGKGRNTTHNALRVKAEANDVEVVVGFLNGEYTTFKTTKQTLLNFKESNALKSYIMKMKPALELHWNQEIDDTEFGLVARYVKRGKTVEEAIDKVFDERDEEDDLETAESKIRKE